MLTDDYKLPNLKSHVPSPLWPDFGLFYQCKRYLHHANKSNFSCNNFSVIDSGKNDFEVTIKEAFHIKFSKPIMNKQLFTQGSSFVLNVF